MAIIIMLLGQLVLVGGATLPSDQSEMPCDYWGVVEQGAVQVMEEEAGWLQCALFSHPTVYNYSSSHSAGLNLIWYRIPIGQVLEQPIRYRNKSSCTKIEMRLEVRPRGGAGSDCQIPVATAPSQAVVPLQEGQTLECPDVQDVSKMADSPPTVTWYHKCVKAPFWDSHFRELVGVTMVIHLMHTHHQGLYFCQVQYQRRGRSLNYTRLINVTAVYPSVLPKFPTIRLPPKDHLYSVKQGAEVRLECLGLFPYLPGDWAIWWTVDERTVEQLADQRFSITNRQVRVDFGHRVEESVLLIQEVQGPDVSHRYACHVSNQRGNATRSVHLQEEASLPSVELGWGLGVTLLLMMGMFVVYHVFWLEVLLLYRSWFGTDERHADDKDYDVYISYARNGEEEHFVIGTLRRVLENELGYSVCIFDRDSLPGGTITDETLSFVGRSRRLLVVLGPNYGQRGSQALLELQAGLQGMALGAGLRVILLQYRGGAGVGAVKELRRARLALALVRWQGERSQPLSSSFWKRLRLALPPPPPGSGGQAGARKLLTQNSTSSQTGLLMESRRDQTGLTTD